jgi:SAM-dependent methyltransferase
MKFIKLDPPGTWCLYETLFEVLNSVEGRRFLEVGCGGGDISLKLLQKGYTGTGIDFSPVSIKEASTKLKPYIDSAKYHLYQGDFMQDPPLEKDYDFAMSFFVMEHNADDVGFLKTMKSRVRPGGNVIISVPGRKDKWSIEDDTAGHIRRYDRDDLIKVMEQAGLVNPQVWSLAVPVSNIIFGLSNLAINKSAENEKRRLSREEQTKSSGVRDIPFKTIFPPFFKICLNRVALQPVFFTQRFFYKSGMGLTLLARAQCA